MSQVRRFTLALAGVFLLTLVTYLAVRPPAPPPTPTVGVYLPPPTPSRTRPGTATTEPLEQAQLA